MITALVLAAVAMFLGSPNPGVRGGLISPKSGKSLRIRAGPKSWATLTQWMSLQISNCFQRVWMRV